MRWLLASLLCLGACAAPQKSVAPASAPASRSLVDMLVIAHRGGALEAPENTLAAIRHGAGTGAPWVEIDVTLSADDVVMVTHEDELHRTAGVDARVSEMSAAQLRELNAGRPGLSERKIAYFESIGITPPAWEDRFAQETLPTLEEVLAIPGFNLMIEMKVGPKDAGLAQAVVEVVEKLGVQDRVALGSFAPHLVEGARTHAPGLRRIGIIEDPQFIPEMLALRPFALAVSRDIVKEAVAAAPEGVQVWTWTIYNLAQAEAMVAAGADGLITDVPAKVMAARSEAAPSAH